MKNILIVDDDAKTTNSLAEDLKDTYGFNVLYLKSSENVIETLEGSIFDIIILDLMMPTPSTWTSDEVRRSSKGLSTGDVLYEKIRKAFPSLPILIYSAKQVDPINDGKTIILRKPELHSEIVNRINELLSNEN